MTDKEGQFTYSVAKILFWESERYKSKGIVGMGLALMIAFAFLRLAPEFWKGVWPAVLSVPEKQGIETWKYLVFLTTMWHALWVLIANLLFYGLYHFKLLQKYKVTQTPWPWESKP
jgi:sterol desaturase/sphingolipid hydroxylase (fatty acid hydroxylase superfamily)